MGTGASWFRWLKGLNVALVFTFLNAAGTTSYIKLYSDYKVEKNKLKKIKIIQDVSIYTSTMTQELFKDALLSSDKDIRDAVLVNLSGNYIALKDTLKKIFNDLSIEEKKLVLNAAFSSGDFEFLKLSLDKETDRNLRVFIARKLRKFNQLDEKYKKDRDLKDVFNE